MARPTLFNEKLARKICKNLADGKTLRAMCREDDELPDRSTVSDWLVAHPEFADQVASAREVGSHAIIEEARDIADDGSNDYMERHFGELTSYVVNGEAVQRSKLRIEQRRWEAEAILPKVYGKRMAVEHSGSVHLNITTASDDELMSELLELAASGRLKLPGGVELVEADEPDEGDDDYSDIA